MLDHLAAFAVPSAFVLMPLGCAKTVEQGATTPVRHIVVREAYSCETLERDSALAGALQKRERTLLQELGGHPTRVRTKKALLREVSSANSTSIVLLYAGHGTSPSRDGSTRQSTLCFRDGRLPVDELLRAVDPKAKSAVFVLDGCWTTDEDVRHAAVPAAVLSASHELVCSSKSGGGALDPALIAALKQGDDNADGVLDTDELLAQMLASLVGEASDTEHREICEPLAPRLRRNAWAPLPVAIERTTNRGAPLDWSEVRGPGVAEVLRRERALAALDLAQLDSPSAYWAYYPATDEPVVRPPSSRVLEFTSATSLGELLGSARKIRASQGFIARYRGDEVIVQSLGNSVTHGIPLEKLASADRSEEPTLVQRVEAGHWARIEEDTIYHSGKVGDGVRGLTGEWRSGGALQATTCGQSFGQCFITTSRFRQGG